MSPEELTSYKRTWSRRQYCDQKDAEKVERLSQKRKSAINQRHEQDRRAKFMKENKTFNQSLANFEKLLPAREDWQFDLLAGLGVRFEALSPVTVNGRPRQVMAKSTYHECLNSLSQHVEDQEHSEKLLINLAQTLATFSYEDFKARFTFKSECNIPVALLYKDKVILARKEVYSYKTNPKEDLRTRAHLVAIKTYQVKRFIRWSA